MSHFLVYVIVPKAVAKADLEAHVQKALLPFNENIETPPHLTDCFCIGSVAREHGIAFANECYAPLSALRSAYANDPVVVASEARQRAICTLPFRPTKEERAEYEEIEARVEYRWKVISGPWRQKAEEATRLHPLHEKPTPDCDTCKGTGQYETTENPSGKWDWYRVGGRFDGLLVGDPRNDGFGNLSLDQRHESLEKNTLDTGRLPSPVPDDIVPFAILDAAGVWHEKGKLGWFATVRNKDEGWPDRAKSILEKHRGGGYRIVAVDCHT